MGIAVLLNVVCLSMARERKYSSPPKFLKRLFAGALGKILCLGNYYHQVSLVTIFFEKICFTQTQKIIIFYIEWIFDEKS